MDQGSESDNEEEVITQQNKRSVRCRTKHPTNEQKERLVFEIERNKPIMIGGHQGPNGTQMKKKAWEHVSNILNNMRAPGSNSRSSQQWNRVWRDLVINAKKRNTAKKRDFVETGGGPAKVPPLSSLLTRILELVSTQAHGVSKQPKGTITKSLITPANTRSVIARFLNDDPVAGPSNRRTSVRSSSSSKTSTTSGSESVKMQERELNGHQEPEFLQQRKLSQDASAESKIPRPPSLIPQDLLTRPVPPPLASTSISFNSPAEAHTSTWEAERTKLLEKLARKDEELKLKDQEIIRLKEDNKFLKTEFIAMRIMAQDLINKMK